MKEAGSVENTGTAKVNIEFCFGRSLTLSSFVTTLNAFSVSWMMIPWRPTRQGFLAFLTVKNAPWKSALRSFGCTEDGAGACFAIDVGVTPAEGG